MRHTVCFCKYFKRVGYDYEDNSRNFVPRMYFNIDLIFQKFLLKGSVGGREDFLKN